MSERQKIKHAKEKIQDAVLARVKFGVREIRGWKCLVAEHTAENRKAAVRVEDISDDQFREALKRIIEYLRHGR